MAANGDTIMKYVVPVIGAVIVALQGVNIHSTGEAATESRTAEQEASAELKELRVVNNELKTIIANMDARSIEGRDRLMRIEKAVHAEEPSPTPSPTPN
jgi:hypothetical protein